MKQEELEELIDINIGQLGIDEGIKESAKMILQIHKAEIAKLLNNKNNHLNRQ